MGKGKKNLETFSKYEFNIDTPKNLGKKSGSSASESLVWSCFLHFFYTKLFYPLGLPENAYKTLLELGGLEAEADYGYDGADEKCKFNRSDRKSGEIVTKNHYLKCQLKMLRMYVTTYDK